MFRTPVWIRTSIAATVLRYATTHIHRTHIYERSPEAGLTAKEGVWPGYDGTDKRLSKTGTETSKPIGTKTNIGESATAQHRIPSIGTMPRSSHLCTDLRVRARRRAGSSTQTKPKRKSGTGKRQNRDRKTIKCSGPSDIPYGTCSNANVHCRCGLRVHRQ